MSTWYAYFKSVAGLSIIDWETLLRQYELKECILSSDPESPNPAWEHLLNVVRAELPKYSASTWGTELKALKQTLINQLNTASSREDFDAFTYFIYFSLNQPKLAPYYAREMLARPETQHLHQYFLKCRYQEILRQKEIGSLIRHSQELNSLAQLFAEHQVTSAATDYTAMVLVTLSNWLKTLVDFLKERLSTKPTTTECHHQYAEVASNLWDASLQFGLDDYIHDKEVHDTLIKAYQQTVDCIQGIPTPNVQKFLSIHTNSNVTTYSGLLGTLSSLNSAIDSDWDSLSYWGSSLYRLAILTYQVGGEGEHKGLEDYLTAYKTSHLFIENLSAQLYQFRNQLEKTLRTNPGSYCHNMDVLNSEMTSVENKLVHLQRSWLRETETLASNTKLTQASQCLAHLLSPVVRDLNHIVWAEHTVYCSLRTEEQIAFEMQQRLIPKYSLETTLTQSDYLITYDWHKRYRKARQILAQIHPDKNPELNPITEFCTKQILDLRDQANKVKRMWRFSQWSDISRRSDDDLKQEKERLTQEKIDKVDDSFVGSLALEVKIEVPAAPKIPLTLNLLTLNENYLIWAREQETLEKTTKRVEPFYTFYGAGRDESFEIESYYLSCQQSPGERRRINLLGKKVEEAEARLGKAISKRDEIIKEFDESITNYTNGIIEDEIEKMTTPCTLEFVGNLRSLLTKHLSRAFKCLTSEEISDRIERCMENYPVIAELINQPNRNSELVVEPVATINVIDTQQKMNQSSNNTYSFFASAVVAAGITLALAL